jgi:hypothetical protein
MSASKRKRRDLERLCQTLRDQIKAAAPESEPSAYGLAVLTRAGWLQVSVSSDDDEIVVHTRFEEPHLAHDQVIGYNRHSGKWNHYLQPETATTRVNELFVQLWPTPEELPRAQFLGAIGRLVTARRNWILDRCLFGPLAERKHLPVLGQPGVYNPAMSIWLQPGQASFSDQDRNTFWECAAEFAGTGSTTC